MFSLIFKYFYIIFKIIHLYILKNIGKSILIIHLYFKIKLCYITAKLLYFSIYSKTGDKRKLRGGRLRAAIFYMAAICKIICDIKILLIKTILGLLLLPCLNFQPLFCIPAHLWCASQAPPFLLRHRLLKSEYTCRYKLTACDSLLFLSNGSIKKQIY